MHNNDFLLPEIICLVDFGGNYNAYINTIYKVFVVDFVKIKAKFRGEILALKKHPIVNDREYTFYHMTHKGDIEIDREPDLRRCERMPWAKPIIENCDRLNLKIWPQIRNGKNRLCIWFELTDEPDYFIIIDIRQNYKLLWTAFVAEYPHEKRKKLKEYNEWLKKQNPPN